MHLGVNDLFYLIISFLMAFISVPLCKKVGLHLGIYAFENQRTVHNGKIVRIGGLAIYLSFMLSMAIFIKPDSTILGILIGGAVVFLAGLLDDIFDLKPIIKFGFQIFGALLVIYIGNIQLDIIRLFHINIDITWLNILVSVIWIAGVSNAINLIDGLDGLAGGISAIVLLIISIIGSMMNRGDIAGLSLILTGSILGFLPYNRHPASVFMGDCGALFIGFMIACISLLGFKTSTFITLGFPIIILFVPLGDTMIAIIRRRLSGKKISEADRSHLHHVLIYKIGLGHKKAVNVLYLVTLLYGLAAIVTFVDQSLGLLFLGILVLFSYIFVELTGMIKANYHPLIGLLRRTTGYPKKSNTAFFEANKIVHRKTID